MKTASAITPPNGTMAFLMASRAPWALETSAEMAWVFREGYESWMRERARPVTVSEMPKPDPADRGGRED